MSARGIASETDNSKVLAVIADVLQALFLVCIVGALKYFKDKNIAAVAIQ